MRGETPDVFPMAVLAYQSGDHERALRFCEEVLSKSPTHGDALHLSGLILFETQQFPQARERLLQASKRLPRDARVFYSLALAESATGDLKNACSHCEKTLSLQPDFMEASMLLADLLARRGEIQQALILYRTILKAYPGNNEARFYLANLELHDGAFEKAISHYESLLEYEAMRPELHYNLAMAYQLAEDFDAAWKHYERAKELRPTDADTLFAMARLAYKQNNSDRGDELLEATLAISPLHIDALKVKADIAMACGDREQAIRCLRHVASQLPRNIEALSELGHALLYYGDIREGIDILQSAFEMAPDKLDIAIELANGFAMLGDDQQLDASFEQLLKTHVNRVAVLENWLVILEKRNRLDRAGEILEEISELQQTKGLSEQACLVKARIQRRKKDLSAAEKTLTTCAPATGRKDAFSINYQFEQIALQDALGKYAEAFSIAINANQAGREFHQVSYDRNLQRKVYQHYKDIFTKDWLKTVPECQEIRTRINVQPVFILGFPRSGTSLVEQILASHPDVSAGGEMPWLGNLYHGEAARLFGGDEPWWEAMASCRAPCDAVAAMCDYYLQHALQGGSINTHYLTDKMPLNINYLSLIKILFPHARIIRMQRHPLDICLSVFFTNFSTGNAFAWDMTDTAYRLADVIDWAEHCEQELGMAVYQCRYENLVARPEEEIAALLAYLDLPWSDNCLAFHKTRRVLATASYAQVNQPLYSRSVGRFRHYVANLANITEALQPLLAHLKYDV